MAKAPLEGKRHAWPTYRLLRAAHERRRHGGQCDIANTAYKDLPEKWQAENKAAATALVEIFKPEVNKILDLEEAAAEVHVAWSKRNPTSELAEVPYEFLPEEEKEKDRAQVRAAMKILLR